MENEYYFNIIRYASSLKENTKKSYLHNLTTILRHVNKNAKDTITIDEILKHADKYYPIIVKESTIIRRHRLQVGGGWKLQPSSDAQGTIRTLVKTLISVMKYSQFKETHKDMYDAWYKYFVELNDAMLKRQDNNLPTLGTSMTWEEIIMARDQLQPGTKEHVILGMYTYIPPRRQNDYYMLALSPSIYKLNEAQATGFIDLKNRLLKVTKYKTADQYGEYDVLLPIPLVESIQLYLNPKIKTYLFTKMNGDAYPSISSFTDAMNTVIKKALKNQHASVNTIRHAAASYVATSTTMLRGEKKQWALAMGHSLSMQNQYVVARIPN